MRHTVYRPPITDVSSILLFTPLHSAVKLCVYNSYVNWSINTVSLIKERQEKKMKYSMQLLKNGIIIRTTTAAAAVEFYLHLHFYTSACNISSCYYNRAIRVLCNVSSEMSSLVIKKHTVELLRLS